LFTGLPGRYDLLAELLSLVRTGGGAGEMVDRVVPAAPQRVLDVATGTAGGALQLARRSPGRVVGLDRTEAMLRRGQDNVVRGGPEGRATWWWVGQSNSRFPTRPSTR
jgi:demethylmenaquinone methyltransferase/2-methoxy-6-polyprenyl-1,4-benzoquinol methylase